MEQNFKKIPFFFFNFNFFPPKNESFPVSCPPSILEGSARARPCRPGAGVCVGGGAAQGEAKGEGRAAQVIRNLQTKNTWNFWKK